MGLTTIDEPLPNDVPPHEPLYQCQWALVPNVPPVKLIVVEPPTQMVDKIAVTELVEIAEVSFTVIFTLMHPVVLHNPPALT